MQWSRRETKTLKLQQATEELGRERTAGGDDDGVVLHIVANQIVEQIEAEKNGQERAHASTPLSMALNLIFAIRSSCRRHGGD